jgi:hypothetical protein
MTAVMAWFRAAAYTVAASLAMFRGPALSLALVVVLGGVAGLPALAALEAGDTRCCRRGVCCHRARPSADTCMRGVCRCAAHGEAGDALPVTWAAAVLPESPVTPALAAAGPARSVSIELNPAWLPAVQHPPPQSVRLG